MKTRILHVFLAVFNLIAFALTVTVNALANALPLNGKTTGSISDSFPNLFTPAGVTFAVWIPIYLLLAGYSVYQLACAFRKDEPAFIGRISWLFLLSSVANIGWVFAWHYDYIPASLVLMLVLFGALLAVYLRLNIPDRKAPAAEKWLVQIPFSVYLGWITVATIANAAAVLVQAGWDGFGIAPVMWTLIVIGTAAAITLSVVFIRRDFAYALVVAWALLGIFIRQIPDRAKEAQITAVFALVCFVIVVTGVILKMIKKERPA